MLMANVPYKSFSILCQVKCGFDIFILGALLTTSQQNYRRSPTLCVINPIRKGDRI